MSDADVPDGPQRSQDAPESATAAVVEAARESDLGLVVGTLLAIYAAAALLTFTDGLNSVVGLMETLTFLGLVYALTALALNLQWGYTGLFNIGVAGFMAVGVYTMGMVVRSPDPAFGPPGLGLPLPVGIVASPFSTESRLDPVASVDNRLQDVDEVASVVADRIAESRNIIAIPMALTPNHIRRDVARTDDVWIETRKVEFVNILMQANLWCENESPAVGIVECSHRFVKLVSPGVPRD